MQTTWHKHIRAHMRGPCKAMMLNACHTQSDCAVCAQSDYAVFCAKQWCCDKLTKQAQALLNWEQSVQYRAQALLFMYVWIGSSVCSS